jgi:GAF domain-containing protein
VVRDVTERRRFEETLTALHDATRDLFRAESRTEVSQRVVAAAAAVLDLPGVVVYRHDPDDASLSPDAESVEAEFMHWEFPTVPVGEGSITGSVFADGDPVHCDDVLDHPQMHASRDETEMRAGSFVPMGDHGVLIAGSRTVGEFDHRTRRLLELFAANAAAAYDRVGREEQLERQRERLAALDELNGVVRDINEALVRQSTREEVERVVCERLADSESYAFAWFGAVDPHSETVELRTEAGVEGYLDGIDISVDPDDDRSRGPTGRAVLTERMQVARNAPEEWDRDDWRDHAAAHGFRSSAAIPVVHEGTLYGVLNVYTARSDAFTGEERAVVGQLGEVVGHAIASIDRKRALLSDEAVELEFQVPDVFEAVGAPATGGTVSFDGRVSLDRTVPVGDGAFVAYGTATDGGFEAVESLVAHLPYWDEATVLSEEFGTVRFELRLSEPPVLSTVAAHGGYVAEARIEDGDYLMTLHFPPTVEVRNVVERVREAYPTMEILTRRQVSRSGESLRRLDRVLAEDLTDRQRAALEAAYFGGFFEWPRERSAQEVADSLGVADATFHQHLRLAQRKLLSAVLDESAASVE